jgi:hypothetical protein
MFFFRLFAARARGDIPWVVVGAKLDMVPRAALGLAADGANDTPKERIATGTRLMATKIALDALFPVTLYTSRGAAKSPRV